MMTSVSGGSKSTAQTVQNATTIMRDLQGVSGLNAALTARPRWLVWFWRISTILFFISFILYLSLYELAGPLHYLLKPLPVLSLTAYLFAWALWVNSLPAPQYNPENPPKKWKSRLRTARPFLVTVAFVAYALADIIVELSGWLSIAGNVVGVFMFAIGHLLMMLAITVRGYGDKHLEEGRWYRLMPYFMLAVLCSVGLFLVVRPPLAIGFTLYLSLLMLDCWRSIARVVCRGSPSLQLTAVAVGYNIFLLSDILNLLDVFVYQLQTPNLALYIVMITYWLAIWLISFEGMNQSAPRYSESSVREIHLKTRTDPEELPELDEVNDTEEGVLAPDMQGLYDQDGFSSEDSDDIVVHLQNFDI